MRPANVRVLVVDDQRIMVERVRQMLDGQTDMTVHFVTDGAVAVETALAFCPTVILQDMIMPGISGLDLIRHYREHRELMEVPVIVLSAVDAAATKGVCFETGANDYLVKLPDPIELLARLRYHSAAYNKGVERDEAFHLLKVSQQQLAKANVELQRLNGQDGLTGIANRRRFDEVLRNEWQRGCRTGATLSVLMCDIDNFKSYNDAFGHLEGDMCLRKVAAVLTENLKRPGDLAARYGGEEFALILPDTAHAGALAVAEGCRRHLEQLGLPASDESVGRVVTLSAGVATAVPHKGATVEQLLQQADRALYLAKAAGRNQVRSTAPDAPPADVPG